MSLYINHRVEIPYLGAAAPYGALILAAPRFVVPYAARRVSFARDVWSPTTGNVVAAAGVQFVLLPPGATNATLQVYSAAGANLPVSPDAVEYLIYAAAAAPVDPSYMVVSWECSP